MSGYRVDNNNDSSRGETLLMRTLPLVTNPFRNSLYSGSINFKHIQHPLLDALIVSAADGSVDSVYTKKLPVAQECVLSWCVKTLHSSYSWGAYKEEVVDTFLNTTSAEWPWWTQNWPELDMTETEFRANITIVPPSIDGNTTVFGISNETFLDGTLILDEIFPSMLTVSNASAPPFIKVRTSFTDKVMFRAVRFSPWLAPNNITHHMERMAQAMTNVIRSDSSSNDLITGTAYSLETYVAVHWAWLTFPLIMLLLSIVFLVATMLKTSGHSHGDIGTWKTSAMPTLMYSLPKDMQNDLVSTTASGGVAGGGSKKVRIRLLPKQGWRVSGQIHHQTTAPPGYI
jgi:hypothetical protein